MSLKSAHCGGYSYVASVSGNITESLSAILHVAHALLRFLLFYSFGCFIFYAVYSG